MVLCGKERATSTLFDPQSRCFMVASRNNRLYVACILAAVSWLSMHCPRHVRQPIRGNLWLATGPWLRNWGAASLPGNDTAYIANGGTAGVTTTGDVCGTLTVGTSAGAGTVQMLSGNLSASEQQIGYGGTGAIVQSGGTNGNAALVLDVGYGTGGNGTYELSGSGLLTSPAESIGAASGTGVFVQSGGTNSLPGGGDLYVGGSGTGSYTLTGSGVLSIGAVLTIVDAQHGAGTFTLSGSGQLTAQASR